MKHGISAFILATVTLLFLVSCSSVPDSATKNPWVSTTLEITGTEGASFMGHYVVRGQEVPVSGLIPKTMTDFEITGCEFRKKIQTIHFG